MNRKGFTLAIVLLVAAAICFWYYEAHRLAPAIQISQLTNASSSSTAPTTSSTIDTSGWKTYMNQQYGFTLKYPPDFHISASPGNNDFYACYLATCGMILHVDSEAPNLPDSYYARYREEPDYSNGTFYYYFIGFSKTGNSQSQVNQILSTFKLTQ